MPTRKETGEKRVAKAKERMDKGVLSFEAALLQAHDLWGLSWREIGTAAGIPYGTAQTAAMRAKARKEEAAPEEAPAEEPVSTDGDEQAEAVEEKQEEQVA